MSYPLPDPPIAPPGPPIAGAAAGAGMPPIAFLVDYDGTIAQTDVSDALMAEFVNADWESHVEAYDAGIVGSRRLMAWEAGLIPRTPTR